MRWKMRETVREADQDIDIIATDNELVLRPLDAESSRRHADKVGPYRTANKAG